MIALLARYKSYLWAGGIALAAGIFIGGWAVKEFYQAGRIKALEKSVELEKQARNASEKALSDLQMEMLTIERDKIIVPQEVIRYVKVNPDCDLSRGAVSLLNRSRGVPETPALSDGEKQAPSTITQPAEVQHHSECAIQYRELAAKHDALIEFIEGAWPK